MNVQVKQAPKLTNLRISNDSFGLSELRLSAPALKSLELLGNQSMPPLSYILNTNLTSLELSSKSGLLYRRIFNFHSPELHSLSQFSPNLQHVCIKGYILPKHNLHPFVGLDRWELHTCQSRHTLATFNCMLSLQWYHDRSLFKAQLVQHDKHEDCMIFCLLILLSIAFHSHMSIFPEGCSWSRSHRSHRKLYRLL